tara:strand:+ start:192936 stop:194699 length:1764 start_codon:yes stop_codon:yes gene_type:complete
VADFIVSGGGLVVSSGGFLVQAVSAVLLDYGDATFFRASRSALVDPREGWTYDAVGWALHETPSPDIASDWVTVLSPVITGGQADPNGGTDATYLEDDNASGYEAVEWIGSVAMATDGTYRFRVYIAKDADETRFPEFQFKDSAGSALRYIDVNTSTGATATRVNTGWISASHTLTSHDASWWLLTVELTSPNTNTIQLLIHPAVGTTLGSATVTAVGGVTVYVDQIDSEAGWKATDVPRILSDGALLVEGARTNLITHSADLSAWSASNASVVGGEIAPDGGVTAYEATDASAVAQGYRQTVVTTTATGAHVLSCYIAKDAVTSRFPHISITAGTGTITPSAVSFRVNTSTGAYHDFSGSGTSITVLDSGAWWHVCVSFSVATTGSLNVRLYPAAASTIDGGGEVATLGSVISWGWQFEAGAYPSSLIQTEGASATRAFERPSFLSSEGSPWPERINSGRFTIDVWPAWSSAEAPAGQFSYILANGNSDVFYLYKNASTLEVRLQAASVNVITPLGITFSAHQRLTFTIDWPAQELTVSGATTGDQTAAITAAEFTMTSTDRLTVGHSTSTTGREFNGVLSWPVTS